MERNSETISIECKDKGILLYPLKSVFVNGKGNFIMYQVLKMKIQELYFVIILLLMTELVDFFFFFLYFHFLM